MALAASQTKFGNKKEKVSINDIDEPLQLEPIK
jgi:hypothetical protein